MVNNNDEETGVRGLVEENEIQHEAAKRMTEEEEALNGQRSDDAAPPPPPPPLRTTNEIIPTTSRNHADSGSRVVRLPPTMMPNAVLRRDVSLLEEDERLVLRGRGGPLLNNYYNDESPAPRCTNHYQHRGNFYHPLRSLPPELFSFSLFPHCEGEQDHHHHRQLDHGGGGRDDHDHDDSRRRPRVAGSTVVGVTSSPTARDHHDHDQDIQEDKTLENTSTTRRYLQVLRTIEAALKIHFCSSSDEDEGDGDDGTESNP